MPYTVRFTRRALADVDAAAAYRAQRSATAAARWREGLLAQLAALEQSPNLYPLADEADDLGLELRELLYGRRRNIHRILFTIEGRPLSSIVFAMPPRTGLLPTTSRSCCEENGGRESFRQFV